MNIIVKQYVREFINVFIIATLSFSVIFGVFDLIGMMDVLLNGGANIYELFLYWLYIIPKNTYYLMPMSVLGSVMYVFGRAARDLEFVVIKSIGGSIRNLFLPLVMIGAVIAILNFMIGEFISSPLKQKAHNLKYKIVNKSDREINKTDDVWLKGEKGTIIYAKVYLPKEGLLKLISIYTIKDNKLSEIINADVCLWNGSSWMLHDVRTYDMEGAAQSQKIMELKFDGLKSPEIYNERELRPDEMSFIGLYKYYKVLKSAGYRNHKILVDLFTKVSYPMASFFTMLLGIAISVGQGKRLTGMAIAVLISLIYWFAYTMALSLGYSGIAHPLIAAWFVPICFGGLSIYEYYRISE